MRLEEEIKQTAFTDQKQKLIVNLLYTGSWLSLKNSEMLRPYRLTIQQYNVLRILRGQYPQAATVNLLIERMLDKSSNASRIVDKLCDKGLVTRKTSSGDRRCVDVMISQKGLDLLAKLDKDEKKWKEMFSGISEKEAGKLNDLLDKFRTTNN